MTALSSSVMKALDLLSTLFVFALGCGALLLLVVFVLDRRQSRDAVLRNYPVIGHMRPILSSLGEFFRQYFFAMDREELPFNRAERSWVERASKNSDSTVAFGSTKYIKEPGTPIFVNCPYPTLDEDIEATPHFVIGPDSPNPYAARSFFNISGMSFGALSAPAVRALSRGAKLAQCWLNTGEGGLSPYHLEGGADIVFQIGTAKYGVRSPDGTLNEDRLRELAALPQVKMFEIKLSQGAKPGKGGILPGVKVTAEIAAIRGIPIGEDLISPNRHPEINSNDDLLEFIDRVKAITRKPVGVKAVLGAYGWLDDLMAKYPRARRGARFFHPGFRRWRHRRRAYGADGQCRPFHSGIAAARARHHQEARPWRAHPDHCVGQAHDAGRRRLGLVRGRHIRQLGARLHVRARLHPVAEVQQEHLPDRRHDP